jgi:integrase
MRLTAATVRTLALPAGVQDRTYFDDELPRFGVRLRAGGSARWVVQYAIGRKERRIVLGAVAALDPGKARSLAKDILARVRLGEDPLANKHEAVARAAETLGAQLPRYLAHKRASLRPRSYIEIERHLTVHAKPLHARSLASFATDRRAVALLLADIAEKSGPVCANLVRASLSALCGWLMREGLLEANPVTVTNTAPHNGVRDRTLDDAELRALWGALEDDRYGAIVKLLLLLGLRRQEMGALCWEEIDFDAELIRLPASRTKNARPHDVPLSAPALTILRAQPRRGEFVFGGRGQGGFRGWAHCKQGLDRKLAGKVGSWTIHDLRRVVSTALHERLDVAPHIVEACLGHYASRSGIPGTYNKARYVEQQRVALNKWADLLLRIVEGKQPAKVVNLRKR